MSTSPARGRGLGFLGRPQQQQQQQHQSKQGSQSSTTVPSQQSEDGGGASVTEPNQPNSSTSDNYCDVEEMTEEEEDAIYNIGKASRAPSPPRNGILQRIASLHRKDKDGAGQGGGVHNDNSGRTSHTSSANNINNNNNNSNTTPASARIQSSYKSLEEEYCKLKFEQTELVALADQRKLQKQRSQELMESLEVEIRERRESNALLRHDKLELEQKMKEAPRIFSNPEEQKVFSTQLNKLLLQRDLEEHNLQDVMETLAKIRVEQREMLDELHIAPVITDAQVEAELDRLDMERRVVDLADELEDLKSEVNTLRFHQGHNVMIGKEITVEEDTVSVLTPHI